MNTPEFSPDMLEKQEEQQPAEPVPLRFASSIPKWIDPDLDFILALRAQGGETLKNCFQCGTCSVACTLSPDAKPFPRKEMAWAVWGLKDNLLNDLDVWLCHQCTDCSKRCPRGAKPADVLAAVRRESIQHYAFPHFWGKLVNQPKYIPLLFGIPALLLGAVIFFRESIAQLFNVSSGLEKQIVYAHTSALPHWLLNGLFSVLLVWILLVMIVGVTRFWRAMKRGSLNGASPMPTHSVWTSIGVVLKHIFTHEEFDPCTTARTRRWSHAFVFYGFIALSVVTVWVITARNNPLITSEFVYPFRFLSPWKMLANLGGTALLIGCLLMIRDRYRKDRSMGTNTYFDWAFIYTLLAVVLTGFGTELLHYLRLEPHRHVVYFIHLVTVIVLLMNLPFSKFAHAIYRTTALVFADYIGRNRDKHDNRYAVGGHGE